ncbi:MAG: UDP-3-O-acyl-N-acetylglucosamine deacetylase, partial [Gammaproteobacteria bacterium]|nr:UDP-3-O-acyl-N-acetylglucosamine deacetylase [Gammaproteobacteria bacterium]
MTQKTIINPLRICGIDVASGLRTCAHIKPASRDTGIQLEQRLNGRLVRTAVGLESALFAGRVGIKTPLGLVFGLEPLLSVLFAFSIDNLVIELESANFPELSGGASAFVFLLQSSGLRKQGGERVCVDANAPVTFSEQGRSIRYAPS